MATSYDLRGLPPDVLLAHLRTLAARDHQLTADLVAHLAEVDARRLYLDEACSSMFTYCVERLHMSEPTAYKRIEAARAAGRLPGVFAGGAGRGRGPGAAAPPPPAPPPPPAVRPPGRPAAVPPPPGAAAPAFSLAPPVAPRPELRPLAEDRYVLKLTLSAPVRDKLLEAQALLRHRLPSGDLDAVLGRALAAPPRGLPQGKIRQTPPPPPPAPPPRAGRRHLPNAVQRQVAERDGHQCSFVDDQGRRCQERAPLHYHHLHPL